MENFTRGTDAMMVIYMPERLTKLLKKFPLRCSANQMVLVCLVCPVVSTTKKPSIVEIFVLGYIIAGLNSI